ncbi:MULTISPECIES: DUF188 domain-containing protein [Paraburkholderia]|uniref:Uncharacterized protein YaiI (UPF0178 family) n=2 Tax=Paraburkholderia TaxID=1822464 RepID=A0A7Z0B0D8_9BURK|nr:DUF188 domain-containing protein [Paraburkholderia bryophila]NYH16534.1 uncharacterized protein YaiI (UPF0178 family) [Paraburkholderia bryophila]
MPIWVDADACPVVIKEMLYRAARRTGMTLTLVANSFLRVPPSPLIRAIQVPAGFDAADDLIAERVVAGDLVITADIPLAAVNRDYNPAVVLPCSRGTDATATQTTRRQTASPVFSLTASTTRNAF